MAYSNIEKDELKKSADRSGEFSGDANRLNDYAKDQIQQAIDAASGSVQSAGQEAKKTTSDYYASVVRANDIQSAILRKTIENRLQGLGIDTKTKNQTQDAVLNINSGNMNTNTAKRKDAAVSALESMIDQYMAQANVNKDLTYAGMNNATAGNILSEQSAGWQNALERSSNQYNAQKQLESARANRDQDYRTAMNKIAADRSISANRIDADREEQLKKIALQQEMDRIEAEEAQKEFENKLMANIIETGDKSYFDAERLSKGEDLQDNTVDFGNNGITQGEDSNEIEKPDSNAPEANWWDRLTNNEKGQAYKEYGYSEKGRDEAFQIEIYNALRDYFDNPKYGGEYDPELYINMDFVPVKDKFGIEYTEEEQDVLKGTLLQEIRKEQERRKK